MAKNDEYWFEFSSHGDGLTYVKILNPFHYTPDGGKPHLKCVSSTASEESFNFQCDGEEPEAQSDDVED